MKRLLQAALLLLLAQQSNAQLSLKLYNYRPTGEFGFVMKPTFSAEVGWTSPFEDKRLRSSFSASYLVMKPRLSSFPIYGTLSDGSGTHVLEGEQSFQKYNIAQLYCGFDLAFIKKEDKFYAYGGLDVTVGAASVDYTDHVESVIDESYSGGGFLGGFRFRLGAEYEINEHIGVMAFGERTVWLISEPAAINWANYYGIGVKYQFN